MPIQFAIKSTIACHMTFAVGITFTAITSNFCGSSFSRSIIIAFSTSISTEIAGGEHRSDHQNHKGFGKEFKKIFHFDLAC